MSDDLRARIIEALNKAPDAVVRHDPENVARHVAEPWDWHGNHEFYIHCALCRGDVESLADAVMGVLAAHLQSAASDELVSTSRAAEIVGVTRPTMVRFLDDGRLPYIKPGKHRRIRLADVLAFRGRISHDATEAVA